MTRVPSASRALPFALVLALALAVPSGLGAQEDSLPVDGGVVLHYEVAGEGPAVVLLHGWTHDRRSWELQLPTLARRYTVVRPDRRGWGRSGGTPDASEDPGDLDSLLSALDLADAHVVGHSQGADVALRFALAHPERVRSLVLYGSPQPAGFGLPWTGPDALPPPSELVAVGREHGLDSLSAVLFSHPLARGFEEGGQGLALAQAMWATNGGTILETGPPSGETPRPAMDRLPEVTVPTLVITGDGEMSFFQIVADALAYGIPDARRVTVSGGGHAVHMQEPERWTAELLRFLREVEGR